MYLCPVCAMKKSDTSVLACPQKWPNTLRNFSRASYSDTATFRRLCWQHCLLLLLPVISAHYYIFFWSWEWLCCSESQPCGLPSTFFCTASVAVMRFNEKELVSLSRQPSEKAAELGMRGPKKGDGNTVYYSALSTASSVSCYPGSRYQRLFVS